MSKYLNAPAVTDLERSVLAAAPELLGLLQQFVDEAKKTGAKDAAHVERARALITRIMG